MQHFNRQRSSVAKTLEVTEPQKSVLTMLNNLINGTVYKILKYLSYQDSLGLHDIDVLCKDRHERFLEIWKRLVC